MIVLLTAVVALVLHLLDQHKPAAWTSLVTAVVAAALLGWMLFRFWRLSSRYGVENPMFFRRHMVRALMLVVLAAIALIHVLVEFALKDTSATAKLIWSIAVVAVALLLNASVWFLR
jgi:peptidoglycan/LPS O-acetylase OafA/YrhL